MMQKYRCLMTAAIMAATVVAAPVLAAENPSPAQTMHRNIIFVLVDDLRFDGMGFLQHELHTPNIDALARGGTYFPNAVVSSSLCSPSRATILTGQTARNHRVVDNNSSSEDGLIFFPQYLQRDAGYQTAFFGKWHMGSATDAPRPGFDKWVSFKGQGTYLPTDGIPPALAKQGVVQTLNVDGTVVPRKGYITDELTDYAMDWLENGRDKSKPFFLYLSHKAVHSDPIPPTRYKDQYANTTFKLPASMADTPENRKGKPMWVQNQRNSWHGVDFFYNQNKTMEDYLKDYYATLSGVDDSLGRIMSYLHQNNLDKNTMVVFYSDNGFLIGDHGLIDKRNAYEGSVRVPMVVYAPGMIPAGVTNPVLVRNLDLAPTFLDVAGLSKPQQFEGVSVLPVATGKVKPSEWKNVDFVYEYFWEWTFPMTPTTFAIERDRLKYIQYHGVWDIEELYDLSNDPDEMNNLIDDPAYFAKKRELRHALFQQLGNTAGNHDIPYTERTSEGIVRRDKNGVGAAPFPDRWLVEPNRPDRLNGIFADTPLKRQKDEAGLPYFPSMEALEKAPK
ncbi:sulfatase [Telmatospirillum sp.]|uniref:sulfatase family protein n=1 Tax=Telmatospirillum sp. TaxID=2079197 RepID=UPI00284AD4CB|nr:sulfatase [Telmatospirillum sp.]MDR3438850.1 sulfatase [Telmatospirillum sp.]